MTKDVIVAAVHEAHPGMSPGQANAQFLEGPSHEDQAEVLLDESTCARLKTRRNPPVA